MKRFTSQFFIAVLLAIIFFQPVYCQPDSTEKTNYYDQAWDLIQKEPEFLPLVIDLLKKELNRDNPDANARKLLGIAYFNSGRYDTASIIFDDIINDALNFDGNSTSFQIPTPIIFESIKAKILSCNFMEAHKTYAKFWPFLSDSAYTLRLNELKQLFEYNENIYLTVYSKYIIEEKYKYYPHHCIFITINESKSGLCLEDSTCSRFLRPKHEGAWADVVVIPQSGDSTRAFAVYFNDYIPCGAVRIDYQKFRDENLSIEEIQKGYEQVKGFSYNTGKECAFRSFTLKTDAGNLVDALIMIRPDELDEDKKD